MRRALLSFFGVLALIAFAQIESKACTCELPEPKVTLNRQVEKARNESRTVFSGKVVEIIHDPQSYSVLIKFRVENTWKGPLSEDISIATGRGGGDCGYQFEVGERYLVYAYGSDERSLGTNICQRTARLANAAADIKVLGKDRVRQKGKA